MVNFHLHVSGPRMRALIALANGEATPSSGIVVTGLLREGLVQFTPVKSPVAEGITLDAPRITDRGRTILELIEADVHLYLSRLRGKRGKS